MLTLILFLKIKNTKQNTVSWILWYRRIRKPINIEIYNIFKLGIMLQGKIKPDKWVESNGTTTLERMIMEGPWQSDQ